MYTVDQAKWSKLDIFNQMANIYSEVGRSFNSQNSTDRDAAIARAIDLFDATVRDLNGHNSPKLKEVLRAKEQYLTIVSNKVADYDAQQSLDRYFMHYAVAARLHKLQDR